MRIKGIFKQTCISEWACSIKLVSSITKKLNKILLKDPNVVDDALIEKPWKAKK